MAEEPKSDEILDAVESAIGADVNVLDNEGRTLLDVAKSEEIKEMLRKHGGKPGKE